MTSGITFIIAFESSEQTPHRSASFLRCLERLNQVGISPLIISSKKPEVNFNLNFLPIKAKYFNKCRYLNYGISQIKTEKFFILDADLIVPLWFREICDLTIQKGVTYMPVFYRLNKGKPETVFGEDSFSETSEDSKYHGGWAVGSFGPVGIMTEDYLNSGFKFDEEIGKSWGLEDNYLYVCLKSKLEIVRHKCPGFFHLWHPKSLDFRNANREVSVGGDLFEFLDKKCAQYDFIPIQNL